MASEWIAREEAAGLYAKATYRAFAKRVRENKRKLWTILKAVKRARRRIVGYGAPAKGNTLLNYYGIGRDTLEYLVDRSQPAARNRCQSEGAWSALECAPIFGPTSLDTRTVQGQRIEE